MRWFSFVGIETHKSRGMEMRETCPSLGRRMATIMVSVRKDVPERLSEPMSRKLMVSCPLLSTWLPDGSMVGSGATVLMRKFGSMVGMSVGGGAVRVNVGGMEATAVEANEAVGVQGTGRNGVGEGVGFAAEVTMANGYCSCAGVLPQAVNRNTAMRMIGRMDFIARELGMGPMCWLAPVRR